MVLTELWAQRLEGSGVVVHAMHPGWADTPGVRTSLPTFHRLTRPLLRTPEQGADTIVWLAAAAEPARSTGGSLARPAPAPDAPGPLDPRVGRRARGAVDGVRATDQRPRRNGLMARYTATLETPRKRRDVAAYLSDFSTTQEWDPGVVEAQRLDHGPVGLGSRFRVVARFLGRRAELTYEIVRHDPDELVTLRGENATVVSLDTMRFSDTPEGGTRVSYEADLTLKGPAARARPAAGTRLQPRRRPRRSRPARQADVSEGGKPASEGTTVIRAGGAREEPRRMSRRRRIAIVGAGVSGLTAAHLLHARHDVTLFEAAGRPGGHACTVDVPVPEGGAVAVDVGFMVLNDRTYPQFQALLAELGVRTRVSDMSFSVSDGRDFEYGGRSLGALFANRRHLADRRFLRMVAEYARFNREARTLLASDAQPSLRGWLQERGFSKYFVERLLVPQASAVWSADPGQMWTFPARFLLEFFANHGMLRVTGRPTWQTIVGGSRAYVEAICARLGDRTRLSSPVASVRRTGDGAVDVTVAGRARMRFDEVVLACHADEALALLADPTPAETAVLGAIAYQHSELVLHSDDRLLPRRRAAHASWNAHLVDPAPAAPTLTYDLKRLQGLETALPVLATLNVRERIDPAKVHATFRFAHPVYTPDAVAAQRRHAEISGADRIHFAGAYWFSGFHEDGVASAHRVAAAVDAAPRRELLAA